MGLPATEKDVERDGEDGVEESDDGLGVRTLRAEGGGAGQVETNGRLPLDCERALAKPRGAFYALMDLRPICDERGITDLQACQQLLDEHHLALVPGSAFGAPGFLRASFAANLETLKKAVERLSKWVGQE